MGDWKMTIPTSSAGGVNKAESRVMRRYHPHDRAHRGLVYRPRDPSRRSTCREDAESTLGHMEWQVPGGIARWKHLGNG